MGVDHRAARHDQTAIRGAARTQLWRVRVRQYRVSTGVTSMLIDGAAARMAFNWPIPTVKVDSQRTATRATLGAISLSNSTHFALILYSNATNPVALRPGRAMLAIRPVPTGSMAEANTIGIVPVAFCNGTNVTVAEAAATAQAVGQACLPLSLRPPRAGWPRSSARAA
jgi:hypothetical protein